MQCIYLDTGECMAMPIQKSRQWYKPNPVELEQICNNVEFLKCPRFRAFQDHLTRLE